MSNPLTGRPLLVIGSEVLAGQIKTLFAQQNAPFSAGKLEVVCDYDAALKKLGEHTLADGEVAEGWGAILFVLEEDSPAGMLTLEQVKSLNLAPLVVVSDDRRAVGACRDMGLVHFLPAEGLTATVLGDVLAAAHAHFDLIKRSQQMTNVQKSSEQRFKDIADHFADWLWEVDKSLKLTFSSSRKRPTQSADVGTNFISCFLPDEKNRIEDDFAALFADPKPFHDYEYWSYDAYGTRLCWSVSGVPVLDINKKVVGYRGIARDVSNQKTSADQLYYLSNNDSLTGLYNRRRFYDELTRTVRQSARQGTEGALMLVDIDRFNYVNDTYGHEIGDRLLVHISQILKDNVRAIDFVARTGSNEFAVILPDVSLQDVQYRVKALGDLLRTKPMPFERGTVSFSTSIGVVRFPEHGKSADELLSKIGMAVLNAKEKGRNRAEMFEESQAVGHDNTKRLEWLDFVSRCLKDEQDRIVLHFQPIVPLNLNSERDLYEVLVRMLDDEGELVSPFKFIQTAEEFGLIGKIDALVCTRAIQLINKWENEGRKAALSINISSRTFDDEEAIEQIKQALRQFKPPHGSVVLELTETALLRDIAHVRSIIDSFKELGAQFALDDCGVGYSSLNYIRQLNLDFIKIDGTFIRNLHRNEGDGAFVKALQDVAKSMGIKTVAEMVENEEIAEKLKELGIGYAQGYYYAIPGPDLPDTVH